MTWKVRTALVVLLLEAVSCEGSMQAPVAERLQKARGPEDPRSVALVQDLQQSPPQPPEPIDWQTSAGVFIGIERFANRDSALYAADDAIDMTYLFTKEHELPPSQTVLLLAGRPHKPGSRRKLDELKAEMQVIEEAWDESKRSGKASVDAETIRAEITEKSGKVGPHGILILYIASHGVTNGGQHILLTADASNTDPKGIGLAEMIHAIQFERGGRLLLFVDACRKQIEKAGWHGAWQGKAFEELKMPGGYAIIVAAASGEQALPGGWAARNKDVQNGIFTRAVLEGLRCNASIASDGFLTLGGLNSYVSQRVRDLSEGYQQPEGRFGGELDGLPFVRCRSPQPVGEILFPKPNAFVQLPGIVELRTSQPELFATVLLCAKSNGICHRQNPGSSPFPAPPNQVTRLQVQYGKPDSFQIHAALSTDRDFLKGETEFSSVPLDRRADRIVFWLNPVSVIFTTRPVILSPQEGQHIGAAGDPLCPSDSEAPCYRIEAEGYVPEGQAPFFAVEPVMASPLKWIQPPTRVTESHDSVSSLIYLGEPATGVRESFKIYLLGCKGEDLLHDGDQLAEFPTDCQVSESVKVYRER